MLGLTTKLIHMYLLYIKLCALRRIARYVAGILVSQSCQQNLGNIDKIASK